MRVGMSLIEGDTGSEVSKFGRERQGMMGIGDFVIDWRLVVRFGMGLGALLHPERFCDSQEVR